MLRRLWREVAVLYGWLYGNKIKHRRVWVSKKRQNFLLLAGTKEGVQKQSCTDFIIIIIIIIYLLVFISLITTMDFLSHDGFRSAVEIPFPITGNLIHHLIHLSNDLHLFFIGFNEQFSSSSGYYKEGIPSLRWGRGEFESIHPCGLYHIRRGVYRQTNALNEIIAKSLLFGY